MRIAIAFALAGCVGGGPGATLEVERAADLDELFKQDGNWLGTASTTSVDLGDDRTLWLFGESFIAVNGNASRAAATVVPNSVALMVGHDVATARMELAYGDLAAPTGFFDGNVDPLGGVHLPDGSALVFLGERADAPIGGFGTLIRNTRVVRIPDVSGSPTAWTVEPVFTYRDVELGGCTVRDGDHVIALVVDPDRSGRLARWSDDALVRGDLADRQWWTAGGWVDEATLTVPPVTVIPDASSRCSLFDDPELSAEWGHPRWVYSASQVDGTIAYREADFLEGPYTAPRVMSMPTVESDELAYGGRVHALTDAGLKLVTFLVTSLEPRALLDPRRDDDLLWPRVGRAFVSIAVE